MKKLPLTTDKNLLVGINTADDAGVYQITPDLALVQTVDFFTPIVDDPYLYGQIAAANSISDVYAMGGRPLTALNIVGFPQKIFTNDILVEILKGGFDKAAEAGVTIVGGHTIMDDELKYGMAVIGLIHPAKIITNAGAQPGDQLILTKPVGSGVVTTAVKVGEQLGELLTEVIQSMVTLNKAAAEVMQQIGAHACTDITGFGLLGHAYELARASNVGIQIRAAAVPIFAGALPLVTRGFVPGGTGNNRYFLADKVEISDAISWEHSTLLFDAQTSGGLLMAVAPDRVEALIAALKQAGVATHAVIGEVLAEPRAQVRVLD